MLGAYNPNDFVGNLNGFIAALRHPTLKALYLLEINHQAGNETYNVGKSTLIKKIDSSYAEYSSYFGKSDKANLRTYYFSLASDIKDFYISQENINSLFNPECVKQIGLEKLKVKRIIGTAYSIIKTESSTSEDKDFADKVKTTILAPFHQTIKDNKRLLKLVMEYKNGDFCSALGIDVLPDYYVSPFTINEYKLSSPYVALTPESTQIGKEAFFRTEDFKERKIKEFSENIEKAMSILNI
jgi:hypothetical protein